MSFSLAAITTRRATSLAAARAARQERNRLRAELDSYQTPAERAELDAILSRQSPQDLDQLSQATGRQYCAA